MALIPVAAVILAGGRGERMGGVSKAEIEIGGMRLIDRVRLALTGCDPILVAAGRSGIEIPGARSIPDLDSDYAGPLAGVTAAVAALREQTGWLVSVAVDTPFFPHDFVARATTLASDTDVVIGGFAGQDYPTNALWRLEAIRTLAERVLNATAPRSLRGLAAELRTVRLDYAKVVAEDPFANVNTPEDLINLRSRDGGVARA